jgi:hypothetical protein
MSQGSNGLQGDPEFVEIAQDGSVRGIEAEVRQGTNLLPVGASRGAPHRVCELNLLGRGKGRPHP